MYKTQTKIDVTPDMSLRFMEIECFALYDTLAELFNPFEGIALLRKLLNVTYDQEQQFDQIMRTSQFRPTNQELAIYERAKGTPYHIITKKYGMSPTTISKYQKDFINGEFGIVGRTRLDYNFLRNIELIKPKIENLNERIN